MKKNYKNDLISIVMRTVGDRPNEIARALDSIDNNIFPSVEVIIVYQGVDLNRFGFLVELATTYKCINITVIQNQFNEDRRAQNLNIGWEAAGGRYIGFLDDDDSFQENHLSTLYDALSTSEFVWVYSQTTLIKETEDFVALQTTSPFYRSSFSFSDLWVGNFIPIHSFLIDRKKLCHHLQSSPFCEELNRSEDWDFLIRLSFFHKPKVIDIFTCNYYICTGNRNTNLSLMNNSGNQLENKTAWDNAKLIIERRKADLIQDLWWVEDMILDQHRWCEQHQVNYLFYIKKKLRRLYLLIKAARLPL